MKGNVQCAYKLKVLVNDTTLETQATVTVLLKWHQLPQSSNETLFKQCIAITKKAKSIMFS